MSPWALIPLASLVATLVFAALLVRRRRFSPPAGPLLGFMLAFAVWSFGEAVARLVPAAAGSPVVLLWIRVEWVGIAFVSASLLHFIVVYIRSPIAERPWFLPAVYGPAALVAGLIGFSDAIVAGWAATPLGPGATLGPWYLPGATWFSTLLAIGWVLLVRAYLRGDSLFRRRSLPLLGTLTVTNTLGALTEVYWPFIAAVPTGLELDTVYVLALTIILVVAERTLHFLPIAAVMEASRVAEPTHRVEPGLSHLFLARHRDPGFEAFRELVGRTPGLCISAVWPPRLQERYGLEATPILWITNLPGRRLAARPRGLEFEVQLSATRFMRENPSTVVLVDDLDFLALTNGFEAVSRFLKRLANQAAARGSTLLACADPEAFTPGQLAMLRGLFDRVREFAPPPATGPRSSVEGAGALLLEGPSGEALEVYRSVAKGEEGVIVSTKNPKRLRRLHGVTAPIVWVSESPEEGLAEAPVAVNLDAAKLAVARFGDRVHPVMFVPDLEQLVLVTSFPKALEFVKGLIDHMAVRDGVLVASVEPLALSPPELAAIRRRFDRVRSLA